MTIDPARFYSTRDVCGLVPSPRGKGPCLATVRHWLRSGQLRGTRRGAHWFVQGAELLRFLGAAGPVFAGPSFAERQREAETARKQMRERHGMDV